MKIKESVPKEDVPAAPHRQRGLWQQFTDQAMVDHREGRATVVEFASHKEYRRMRSGTQLYWQKLDVWVNTTIIDQPDGTILVYLSLEDRNPKPVVLGKPRGRPRKSG